jgi:methylated-DNA-[protein]-cysteine S-methyltransferase
MYQQTEHTPFGWLTVHANHGGVTRLDWDIEGSKDDTRANDVSRETWRQIHEYCGGLRQVFDIPLDPGASPALIRWLGVLRGVSFGTTVTYKDFANLAGVPKAARAAGSACARNPIPLIIPCHRVTRHDGSLGNFGAIRRFNPKDDRNLAVKRALIDHEARITRT